MTIDTIRQVSEKLSSEFYHAGDAIFKRNSTGKEMYVIYNGKIGWFSNNQMIKEINYNEVFGEHVLSNNYKRPYRAKAMTDWELLVLHCDDYRNIITNQCVVVMQKNKQLLSSCPKLSRWDLSKIERVWYLLEERKVSNGVLYDQGNDTEGVYIVKSGTLQVHSIVEIDNFRQYPISNFSWEIERTTNTVKCLLGTLKVGSIFGFLEILNKSDSRMSRVSTTGNATVLYLSTRHFLDCFNETDIIELIKDPEVKSAQQAVDEIVNSQNWKSFKKNAIINAAKSINKKPAGSLDFINQNYEIDKFMHKVRFDQNNHI